MKETLPTTNGTKADMHSALFRRTRLTCLMLVGLVGGLLLPGASALASEAGGAPPERPVTEACSGPGVPGVVRFCGKLNPGAVGKAGFFFEYGVGASCAGGSKTVPGGEVEGQGVEVSSEVFGLQPATEYTVCLVATNSSNEEAVGSGVSFVTPPAPSDPPERPVTEACSGPGVPGVVRFCGKLNPGAVGKAGFFFEYGVGASCAGGSKTVPGGEVEGQGVEVSSEVFGLQPATEYTVCLVATNSSNEEAVGQPLSFLTMGERPTVQAKGMKSVGATEAVFQTLLDSNNEDANCYFEYSTNSSLAGAEATPGSHVAAGLEAQLVLASVAGLTPNASYWYRAVALNGVGRTYGPIESFTTSALAPQVTTGPVEGVNHSTATLTGTLNPQHARTTYRFQYGASETYGASMPAGEAGSGLSPVPEIASVGGLTPGTTYHFRLLASNAGGTTYGADQTFTTVPVPPQRPVEPPSATGPATTPVLLGVVVQTAPPPKRHVAVRGQKKHEQKHRKTHTKKRKSTAQHRAEKKGKKK